MAERDDEKPKRGPFKEGNTAEDGSYLIGRGRTPEAGKFRKGDGRKRGRRAKGTRNVDTDLIAEAKSRIVVNEGGKQVMLTKQQALIKCLFAEGLNRNVQAIRDALTRLDGALARADERKDRVVAEDDRKLIADFLASLAVDDPNIVEEEEDGGDGS